MSRIDADHGPAGRRAVRIGPVTLLVRPWTCVVTPLVILAVLLIGAVALTIGRLPVAIAELPGAVFGVAEDPTVVRAVHDVRLPRVLSAVGAGASLGISGALFQSLSRNPLGSPDVIGFTSGAASGALLQIVVFGADPLGVAFGAIIGGLVTAVLVLLLARQGSHIPGHRLVLVGIGVGATASALNAVLLARGSLEASIQANLWLSGSLDARGWGHVIPVLVGVSVVTPIAVALSRAATLMEFGDDTAKQLGVRVEHIRLALVGCAVVLAALASAAVGPIAFIALASPQLARRLLRTSALPVVGSAAIGAALLIAADVVTKLLPVAFTIPIGRMTGILGGLYLLWLLMPRANQGR